MAVIHVLDEVTANQIAAGEVVERPVNAVKELVENAVDASAHEIEVEIADGGMTYIRITDDGSGMSPEDAKLSVLRHATSKISSIDNIYHIASLGFRGEALASITSVSRAAITTRRREDEEGTVLEMEGGDITEVKPCGAPVGTTVEIRDLFYNVPARKKFLKSERTESSRINSMVGKLALANPDIAFRLINNGRTVIETPGNGRLMDVVSALYGTKTASEMLAVKEEGEYGFLEGLISKPSLLKSSRQYQTVIINRRVVESAVVTKAVDNAYHSLLPKNGYPLMVLAFQVSPEFIDVNVHPQKREIKFSDEQSIFRMVYHAVLGSLTSQSTVDSIARNMTDTPSHETAGTGSMPLTDIQVIDKPVGKPDIGLSDETTARVWEPSAHKVEAASSDRMAVKESGYHAGSSYVPPADNRRLFSSQSVFGNYGNNEEADRGKEFSSELLFERKEENAPVVPLGQVSDCFILCQHGQDLLIIDQHAAHERVRYDKLAERAEGIPVQELLIPCLVQIDREDMAVLEENAKDIERLGVTFEQAGPDVIRVTGAPEDLSNSDIDQIIRDLLKAYHDQDVPSPETLRHRMMAYAACRGAIKRGDPLNIRQMKELIADLFHTSRPFVCPHGRPTIVKFTPVELGRLFKRS